MISRMAASASSSFSSSRWRYDAFLSFRGEDTRNKFTAHLKDALRREGINTFMDDDTLRRGEVISPALLTAIESSMYSIIVLSENYASSEWCLEELVKILECKKSRGQTVIPIFYNVDPSDVQKQQGKFGEALAEYEENLENMERVKIWRDALTEVANLGGWDSRKWNESMLIKDIVTDVSNNLFSMYSSDEKNLVGICTRIKEVESLLCMESLDVRIVGIWGMPGIGKTTLADAVYKRVRHQFESSAFLPNVGEVFKKHGLIGLQQELLSLLVDDGKLNIRGCTSIQARLCSKKVLIVLDDVKDLAALEYLTDHQGSFGQGSRIIITTKDKNLLPSPVKCYEIGALNYGEAMELLRHYSSKYRLPEDDLKELSKRVTTYAKGLPLALKILGSSLSRMEKDEWKSHLDKLKYTPDPNINQVLRLSYDELDPKAKDIFLDIACFFKGEDKDHVMEILKGCDFFPHCGIRILLDKSLITISNNKLQMHDLIQQMGMEVVREKSPNEPGKWSRLWSQKDASRVMKKKTGTEEVKGIFLDLSNLGEISFTSEGFEKMNNLRLLKVYQSHTCYDSECPFKMEQCEVRFSEDFKFHSDDLRYLYWQDYSLKSLPDDFNPESLVELNMPYNHIEELWEGRKDLEKLKFMELSHSQCLVKTPDLSRAHNLERLVLEGCKKLRAVHPSLAALKKLIFLSLKDCIMLRDFPSSIELESLQILILSGCSKLQKFPEIKEHMEHLSKLFLDGTAIEELPPSIENASRLVELDLTNCKKLRNLPNSIGNLKFLETVHLSDCSMLDRFPESFGKLIQLRKLIAERNSIRALPTSFADLRNLELLSFRGCKDLNLSGCNIINGTPLSILSHLFSLKKLNLSENNFVSLSISQLPQLTGLRLLNCTRLQVLHLPSSIEVLNAHNCTSLETMSNLQQCAGLRHAIFTNCFKMQENQSNVESSFGTLVTNIHRSGSMSRYHLDHGRPLIFRTLIPGSKIPDWFNHQSNLSFFSKRVPNYWNNSDFLGFALCAVLSLKDLINEETHYLSYSIGGKNSEYKLETMRDFIPHRVEDGLIESDHIWMAYAPAPSCKSWPHSVDSIHVTFLVSGSHKPVKSCGFRLVYTEDVRDNNATMIQHISPPQRSSVVLEELDHSIPEDSKVGRSLDPRDDEYNSDGDNSYGDDEYNSDGDYSYSDEGNPKPSISNIDIGSTSMHEQGMWVNQREVDIEHKKKKAKILK